MSELNDIKTAVAVFEMNREGVLTMQCQQEIETVQALLRGKCLCWK